MVKMSLFLPSFTTALAFALPCLLVAVSACTPTTSTVRFLPSSMNTTNSMTFAVEGNGVASGSVQSQCTVAGNVYQACGTNNAWCLSFVCLGTDVRLVTLNFNSAQSFSFPPNPTTLTIASDGVLNYEYNSCI